ncbi:hypothetical protein K2173_014888 [Erythroxylum novogranatense]|uniref:Phytosulfokine n=1 Tax=Erythroxylum novogranatense TaxID=1862640 RepID=A0AAV8TH89_9ROSI|nr:hypothetical protein K2173_014888 [Erythroxylum novogranatense]
MSKPILATFFLIVLLCSFPSQAARHEPAFYHDSKAKNHNQKVVTEQAEAGMEESCEGVGEEECLTRRTLVAHLDYVYTNKHKP